MKKLSFLFLLACCFGNCGRFGNKDATNSSERIVCLSKQLTEMMFAIGKGSSIVACDLSSTYPDSAKLLKTVGYHRALSAESIISMELDLVIHSNDIGPDNVQPQLLSAGLKIKTFGGARTIDSAKLLLKELGDYFNAAPKADSVIKKMDADIEIATTTLRERKIIDTPTVMIIHFGRANNIYFVMSGRGGTPDKMIEMAGGRTAHYDAIGARQLSAEAVATANPDIIIATDYGYDQMGTMEKFASEVAGVSLTNAAKNGRIYRFEEHDLIYFGPRSGENIIKLMNLIHPVANGKIN